MHNTIWRMSAVALAVIVTTAIVAGVSYAKNNEMFGEKFKAVPENRDAIQTALDNNDYNAWLEAVGSDSQIAEKITAENFPKLVEINQLRQQINSLEEELDIKGFRAGGGQNFHGKMGDGNIMKNMELAKEALENNDYDAWIEAVGADSPIAQQITAENFSKLVEAHQLMEEEKFEEAKQIRDELGINQGRGR